jgi:hypothetical protein
MEIWYSDMDSCLEDYRKESSVKWKIRTLSQILRSTPTNVCPTLILEGEDYGLKVSIDA